MKLIVVTLTRLFVGCLFIYSGLIKANDTVGFAYKLVEYFEEGVLNIPFFIPYATLLATVICVFEVALGIALLLGSRIKLTLWLSLLMIVFFTFLTFYSAYFQKVLSCGCFGDAIKLTPWESFTKDLVLLICLIVLFIGKEYIRPLFFKRTENIVIVIVLIASTLFPIYTYSFLPVVDYRPYAIGKNIPEQTTGTPDETKFFYILKDKATSELIDVDYWPENWTEKYVYIESHTEIIKKGIEPEIKDFVITDFNGDDYTEEIISNPNNNFLLICYNIDLTNTKVFEKINEFVKECNDKGIDFIALTASTEEEVAFFKKETNSNIKFYNCDGTVLKTMIRSNPGLMYLKDGVVNGKWSYNSFPIFSNLNIK